MLGKTALLTSFLYVPTLAHAVDLRVGRRGFIGGIASLVGGLTGRSAPAPAVASAVPDVTEMTTAARVLRVDRLAQIIGRPTLDETLSGAYIKRVAPAFQPEELEIIKHWGARSPSARMRILEKVERVKVLDEEINQHARLRWFDIFHVDSVTDEMEAYLAKGTELNKERNELEREIRIGVSDWPWSSFRWSEVFAVDVAEAERSTAMRLNVPLEQVQQLTEHLIQIKSYANEYAVHEFKRAHLLSTLSSPNFDRLHPPIYSTSAVAVLLEELDRRVPALARSWGQNDSYEVLNQQRSRIRSALANAAPFVERYWDREGYPTAALQVKFKLFDGLDSRFRDVPLKPEWLLPSYAQLFEHFDRLQSGLLTLAPSAFKTITLEEIENLRKDMIRESTTLPPRTEYENRYAEKRTAKHVSRPKSEDWSEEKISLKSLPPEEAIRWARTLETMSVGVRILVPTVISLLAELELEIEQPAISACAAELVEVREEPAPPLQIEAKPDESIEIEENELSTPVVE